MDFREIIRANHFKAAMLDFDGTITEKGVYAPSTEMAELLVRLAKKMPIAFCTGRQLESFVKRGFSALLEVIEESEKKSFLQNLHLVAENGSIGYSYDLETQTFKKFYEVDWPENFVSKSVLLKKLEAAIAEYGSIYYEAHKVIVVMRTKLHDYEDRDIKEVYDLSQKIYEISSELLAQNYPGYEDYLHVGNSGIGVIICPANGDKDRGIEEFGKFLTKEKRLLFKENFRDILVVGDSAQPGGNDHYFLKGKVGMPFNVGEYETKNDFPIPVVGLGAKKILNAQGTAEILNLLLT